MSPEIQITVDEADEIKRRLPSEGFEELHNIRAFRSPDEKFVVIDDNGTVLSDSQELLRKISLGKVGGIDISKLGLSTAHRNALRRYNINTVQDVISIIQYGDGNGYNNLCSIRSFGNKGAQKVTEGLIDVGVQPIDLGVGLLRNMVRFIPKEQLISSGFTQAQVDLAVQENNRPKKPSMVRHTVKVRQNLQNQKTGILDKLFRSDK